MKLSQAFILAGLAASIALGSHKATQGADATAAPDDAAWQTEFRERRYRVARPVWETTEQETRTKVMRPVWETQWREETYTVRKPLVETSMREEQYTTLDPVTVYQPQTVDQGQFVLEQVVQPRKPATRLKWVPGGWTVDAQTGQNYWKPPMLRPVQVARPPRIETRRVWQPNLVETQVPATTFSPRVHVRKVPVQQVRYVEEQRTRKVPQRVCRMVEQEIVQRVPVTVCRTVYEEKVERVPVRVPRCSPAVVPPTLYDEHPPALAPLPAPAAPISPPELDPLTPVPQPAPPAETPESGSKSSRRDSDLGPYDPAAMAIHPLPELLTARGR